MSNKTAALLLPGQRGLPAFPPPSTVVQQHVEQHQLGSMTVNFKMSVVTSGPHDGLFITTGIQTNNSNSGANGGTTPGNAWWRSMDQLAFQQVRDQPALTPAPTACMLPMESLRTVTGQGAAKSLEQSPFPAVEESRSRAIDSMYSRSVSGTEELHKTASINEEYFKTTPAVRSPSPQPAPQPRQRSALNGGEKSPRHYYPNTRIAGLTLTEGNGDSWPNREGKGAERYNERSIPIKLDAPSQESTIKLNTFTDNSVGLTRVSRFDPLIFKVQANADISGDSRQVVELKQNLADEYLLNDTTTTTTTLEVFRAGNDHSNPVDYYKLPPDPFSQGFEPRYVKADGPSYEMSTSPYRSETRFSDRARHSADVSFASPTQQFYVTEPANTPMSEAIRWGQPDAGASRPQSRDQGRSESRPVSSISPLSSNWNVEQQSAPHVSATTTILRRQRNEHKDRRVVPSQAFEGIERTCPPVPPKPLAYHQLRRGVSQPELLTHYRGVSGARMVPPRPTTRKPHPRATPPSHSHRSRSAGGERQTGEGRVRSTSGQPPSYLQPEQLRRFLESAPDRHVGRAERPRSAVAYYPPPVAEVQGMGARSASVNEIFKLYQTRDCLGRVVQQLRLRAFLLSRQSEEKEGLSPLLRLTPTTVREEDCGEEEEDAEFEDASVNGISLDELLLSLKELEICGDTMTSTSSSSLISDLSPSAEWTRSRFIEPLEGEDTGISLSSRNIDKSTTPTSTTTADAISVDELKGLIARHTPMVGNPISPHLLRLPQLERTLSTLDELSSEEREDAGSLAPSQTASESTTNEATAIRSRQSTAVAIFPARTITGDGGGNLKHSMNELASRVEELEPSDLLSEIFPSFAHLRPNEYERKAGGENSSLLPPLPKRPAPPSYQRTRVGRSRLAPLACSKSEEDGVLEFENLESEPRRAGIAAARQNDAAARVTDTESPNPTQPKFHVVADGFRLRIVNE